MTKEEKLRLSAAAWGFCINNLVTNSVDPTSQCVVCDFLNRFSARDKKGGLRITIIIAIIKCIPAGVQGGRNLFPFTKIKNTQSNKGSRAPPLLCSAQHWFMIPGAHTRPLKSRAHTQKFLSTLKKLLCWRNEFIHREGKKRLLEMVTFVQFPPRSRRVGDAVSWLFVNNTKQPHTLYMCVQCTLLPLP